MTGVRSPIFYYFELLDLEEHRQSSLFFSHGLMSTVTSLAKKSTKVQKKCQKFAENAFWFNPFLGREAMQQQRKTKTGATKQGQRIEGGYVQYRGS